VAKFIFTVVSDIFSIIISVLLFPPTYKTVCKFMCTEKNVPGSGEVYRLLEKCGSSVWNFGAKNFEVAHHLSIFVAPCIWLHGFVSE
jgi:hypothetical protein